MFAFRIRSTSLIAWGMAVRSILRQLQVAGVAKIPDGDFGNSRKDHFVVELADGHESLASFCS